MASASAFTIRQDAAQDNAQARPPSRSTSRTRTHTSRPTTPLRPPSRSSIRNIPTTTPTYTPYGSTADGSNGSSLQPLASLEPAFAELADGMADLEANILNLEVLNESVTRFNENFASLLYGLNMSAFCVDFSEAPGVESFRRARERAEQQQQFQQPSTTAKTTSSSATIAGTSQRVPISAGANKATGWENAGGYGGGAAPKSRSRNNTMGNGDVDATFLTTDTSFVENPPDSVRPPARYANAMSGGVPSSRVPPGMSTARKTAAAAAAAGGSKSATGGLRGGSAGRGSRGSVRGSGTERSRGRFQR